MSGRFETIASPFGPTPSGSVPLLKDLAAAGLCRRFGSFKRLNRGLPHLRFHSEWR
jgi:hypothetical protein